MQEHITGRSTPPPPPAPALPPVAAIAPRQVTPPPRWMTDNGHVYATYEQRVGAHLLDVLITFVVLIGFIIVGAVGAGAALWVIGPDSPWLAGLMGLGMLVLWLVAMGGQAWNIGWRQGQTGQSLGKQYVGIEVVREQDGTYLGGGLGLVRALVAAVASGTLLIGYLWPLWDDRNQTWHDLAMGTLVIVRR